MGEVYEASRLRLEGAKVAVKVMSAAWMSHRQVAMRFERELNAISKLSHPHTITFIDNGHLEDGRIFIVTDLLVGKPLDQVLREERQLSVQRCLLVASGVASALAHAHEKGILHRDLKPGNVFLERVTDQEVPRVLDFGLARLPDFPVLTLPDQIFGTPGYMSPEQCSGSRDVNHKTDLHALGALMYECLTGRPAFVGDTLVEILLATQTRVPPPPREFVVGLHPTADALVMELLAKDPRARPDSALQVRYLLDELLHTVEWGATEVDEETSPDVEPTHVRADAQVAYRVDVSDVDGPAGTGAPSVEPDTAPESMPSGGMVSRPDAFADPTDETTDRERPAVARARSLARRSAGPRRRRARRPPRTLAFVALVAALVAMAFVVVTLSQAPSDMKPQSVAPPVEVPAPKAEVRLIEVPELESQETPPPPDPKPLERRAHLRPPRSQPTSSQTNDVDPVVETDPPPPVTLPSPSPKPPEGFRTGPTTTAN